MDRIAVGLRLFRFIGLPSCLLEEKTIAEADLFPRRSDVAGREFVWARLGVRIRNIGLSPTLTAVSA
jgi:hypothetical protein